MARTEQSERVRLAESRPCRDGDVYHLKRHPAYVPPALQSEVMHPSDVMVLRDRMGRITGYVYDPGGEAA